MSTALSTLTGKLAKRLGMGSDGNGLTETLKLTCFRQRGNDIVTDAQMEALLIVAEQYGLNPFTKELFAFSDKGAIVPVVSVDGWSRIINENPAFNGMEFRYSEEIVTMPRGKPCPAWCEVVLYRKDRDRPTVVREYLDEVYQAPRGQNAYDGPWQSHTKRFLRHKTLIQGARIAFGFAGIYDEDEAHRIIDAGVIDAATGEVVQTRTAERAALPACPAENFAKKLPTWRSQVEAGGAVADLLAMLQSKYTLSAEQIAEINALAPSADPATAAEQEARDAFVAQL
ncbi:MAG TPA: phage recombination protein Bet [Verrucomicrobiales bacterium]|nr:phage recombination protein Bet [Verrucomicrobiales bacterium]